MIKELGANGGGFYNTNSGHPFEKPEQPVQPVRDLPAAGDPVSLTRTFGLIKDKRQGYAILGVMGTLWAAFTFAATLFETRGAGTATQAAGVAMEGKETRFGEWASALFASSTTGTSTGAVNDETQRLSELSLRQNEEVKRVSSWAAILFAPTLVGTIYRMNFTHLPELHWRVGYPFAVLLMLLVSLILYTVFKKRGWLSCALVPRVGKCLSKQR